MAVPFNWKIAGRQRSLHTHNKRRAKRISGHDTSTEGKNFQKRYVHLHERICFRRNSFGFSRFHAQKLSLLRRSIGKSFKMEGLKNHASLLIISAIAAVAHHRIKAEERCSLFNKLF
ncbi:MAG: hypothetical protein E6Q34_07570 [Burkholderiaceae bacterium]|nr:MAG: hypothetical protein E6Q34_07570 [Burkholderiaceae bacterium]